MSSLLLRQVCQRLQASIFRQTSQAAAVRLNTTSAGKPQDENSSWRQVIEGAMHREEDSPQSHSVEAKWKRRSETFNNQYSVPPQNAYSGRSAEVINGDVAKAAKQLDRVLNQNSVARDWFTNRRHKPKGEERRKLISLRWRRRFKHEVGKKVELVQQIRRRGA